MTGLPPSSDCRISLFSVDLLRRSARQRRPTHALRHLHASLDRRAGPVRVQLPGHPTRDPRDTTFRSSARRAGRSTLTRTPASQGRTSTARPCTACSSTPARASSTLWSPTSSTGSAALSKTSTASGRSRQAARRHLRFWPPRTSTRPTPPGNLMLDILLSFAQYERELTMERTATK